MFALRILLFEESIRCISPGVIVLWVIAIVYIFKNSVYFQVVLDCRKFTKLVKRVPVYLTLSFSGY